jgi:hypothetical protein
VKGEILSPKFTREPNSGATFIGLINIELARARIIVGRDVFSEQLGSVELFLEYGVF